MPPSVDEGEWFVEKLLHLESKIRGDRRGVCYSNGSALGVRESYEDAIGFGIRADDLLGSPILKAIERVD